MIETSKMKEINDSKKNIFNKNIKTILRIKIKLI